MEKPNIDYILKVTGNILLRTKEIDARPLASLCEESDLSLHIGLARHQLKRVIIELTEHFNVILSEDAFDHSDMKYWVHYILSNSNINIPNFRSENTIKAA